MIDIQSKPCELTSTVADMKPGTMGILREINEGKYKMPEALEGKLVICESEAANLVYIIVGFGPEKTHTPVRHCYTYNKYIAEDKGTKLLRKQKVQMIKKGETVTLGETG